MKKTVYSKHLQDEMKPHRMRHFNSRLKKYHSKFVAKRHRVLEKYHMKAKKRRFKKLAHDRAQQVKANRRAESINHSPNYSKSKHHFHVDKMGTTIVCCAALLVLGVGGYAMYHGHMVQAHQNQIAREQKAHEISCTVKGTPKSPIYANNNQVGTTNADGSYHLHDTMIGSRLWTKYGSIKSNPFVVTRSDKGKTLNFTFNYLKGNRAQKFLNNYYHCITNLDNHNDQNHNNDSLGNYFVNGSQSPVFNAVFKDGKAQYRTIQKNKKHPNQKIKGKAKNKQVPYTSLHYTVAMKNAVLNHDGTVTLSYGVRKDFAGDTHDHIEVYNDTSILKRVNGQWKIVSTKASAPQMTYDN